MVGDHVDISYDLPGPIPAGPWLLVVTGFGSGSLTLQADLFWVFPDGGDQRLDREVNAGVSPDGGFFAGVYIDAGRPLPAVPSACGDTLRVTLSVPSGGSGAQASDLVPGLSLP